MQVSLTTVLRVVQTPAGHEPERIVENSSKFGAIDVTTQNSSNIFYFSRI